MKKTLALILTAAMTLSMFAGCNSKPAAPAPATPAAPTAPTAPALDQKPAVLTENITLKFANYAILESGYEPFWTGVKKGFEEKYPNIKVEYVSAPYGEVVNQVINMAGGGDKVDMMFGEISWIPTLEDAGLAVSIDEVLKPEFLADFYPKQLEACSIGGKAYGLPMYVSPFLLYYNKDLFKAAGLDPETPPTTYDEMMVMAEKLSMLKTADGNKVYPFGQTTASVPISGSALNSMVANFGGEVLSADGKLNSATPQFKQAYETLKAMDDKGYNPQNAKLKDLRNLFALGQLAMYYDQSWGFNGVSNINPEAKGFTASAMPLKGGSGNGDSILQAQVLIYMDNGDLQREAASLFTEYLVAEDVLADYIVNITPAYPSRKSMSGMAAIQESSVLKGAASSVEKTVPTAFVPTLNDINLELCTLAQAVTVGDKSFDEAYAVFEKAVSALLG